MVSSFVTAESYVMSFPFYDRIEESEWLRDSLKQVLNDCSRMLVITGRRRVGKTALVNHVFEDGRVSYLFLFVNKEMTTQGNLQAFWKDNAEALNLKNLTIQTQSFSELFQFLFERAESQPMVLMIDEFQNLESLEPSFFGELQKYWDRRRKKTKMLLILTGSVATAMREITENINAPLYGRKDGQLILQPFSTATVKKILSDFNPDYTPEDLLTLHMIAGGVPKYIEEMMQSGRTDSASMLRAALTPSSYFITEGETLLRTEFKDDYALYFQILSNIASGKSKRSEILSSFEKNNVESQLYKLENYWRIIRREEPVGGAATNRGHRFVLTDPFLLFWFRYIYPNRSLIEFGKTRRLLERVNQTLPDFVGRHVLESYFKKQLWESGNFNEVGSWWDRKGENEIDIVAVNPFDKEILFVEVKRNRSKYDEDTLRSRALLFLSLHREYQKFAVKLECRSLEDL